MATWPYVCVKADSRGVRNSLAFSLRVLCIRCPAFALERYDGIVDYSGVITFDPAIRSGLCIRGMRVAVLDVLESLAAGIALQEIVAGFPTLTGVTTGEDSAVCRVG
ncbi:MAG: DUF433 domain-containing protein [bacterium]|nr:DUF433 domain-containing protein [bacterium]